MTLTKPISLADLIGGAADEAMPVIKRRGRPPGSKARREEEIERAAVVAVREEREAHLPAKPEMSPAQDEHEAAEAKREYRIRENIKKSLAKRLEHNIAPMAAKQLALELAHFNAVHLSGSAVEIIERIAEYARDPASPLHERALMFLAERSTTVRGAFWMGWLAGFAYFLISCWWVAEAFLVNPAQAWMAREAGHPGLQPRQD